MKRNIPGKVILDTEREYRYIESKNEADFKNNVFNQLFDSVINFSAQYGGVISENCKITTVNGVSYFGLSYKGDIDGWRKDFKQGALNLNLRYAKIENNDIKISDGNKYPLDDCIVEFY